MNNNNNNSKKNPIHAVLKSHASANEKHGLSFHLPKHHVFVIEPYIRRPKPIKATRRHKGVGSIGSVPSTFDIIHPIDLIFGTYNELSLCFQLVETTWCLIGFHGNYRHINDVTGGRHLGFSNFKIYFIFEMSSENGDKMTLRIRIYKIVRSIVKLSVFTHFLAKIVTFLAKS